MPRAFEQIPMNIPPSKPRRHGMTEIRGPYYDAVGPRRLRDVFETMGEYIDGLKFAGGTFALMPASAVREINELAHEFNAYVSTGGWIEYVLTQGPNAVDEYLLQCKELGFDVVELSVGFISLTQDDLLSLVRQVQERGLKAKPELGIQFGAGGDTPAHALREESTRSAGWVIERAKACLAAGADVMMIESEGITENVDQWRTDVVEEIAESVGLEHVMFEAADPPVFEWYVKNFGPNVNLFVDNSQIVQLQCLRAGIWGTKSTWGRVVSLDRTAAPSN